MKRHAVKSIVASRYLIARARTRAEKKNIAICNSDPLYPARSPLADSREYIFHGDDCSAFLWKLPRVRTVRRSRYRSSLDCAVTIDIDLLFPTATFGYRFSRLLVLLGDAANAAFQRMRFINISASFAAGRLILPCCAFAESVSGK